MGRAFCLPISRISSWKGKIRHDFEIYFRKRISWMRGKGRFGGLDKVFPELEKRGWSVGDSRIGKAADACRLRVLFIREQLWVILSDPSLDSGA
jgi:hypothetical protein